MEPIERPRSAPGIRDESRPEFNLPSPSLDGNAQAFREMEERAADTMAGDNRGHKLPLAELCDFNRRPTLLDKRLEKYPTPTTDRECEAVENSFISIQHYHGSAATAGLSNEEIRLLYSNWSPFAQSNEGLQSYLSEPQRLNTAITNAGVRSALGASQLAVLMDAIIKVIEVHHTSHKALLQLADELNFSLALLEEGFNDIVPEQDHDNGADLVPASLCDDREKIMQLLAICQENLRQSESYMDALRKARAGLVQAVEYAHLVGRFLSKRHQKTVQLQRERVTPETSISFTV